MNGDEQLLRGRIYGADHDHPGPKPGRGYAELVGGPLDGLLLGIHGWRTVEVDDGVALSTGLGQFPGGRALCDPRPGEPRTPGQGVSCRFCYSGDTPGPQPRPSARPRQVSALLTRPGHRCTDPQAIAAGGFHVGPSRSWRPRTAAVKLSGMHRIPASADGTAQVMVREESMRCG
ncbi:hypothetical protein ALMP_40610 [Streptomyces sp. A012304]|nr:hypothetical protein ALMP_40610 [Streptomyces sp. A012304]